MIINLSSIISLVALLFYGTLVWIVLSHEGRSRVIRTFSLYLVTMIIWSLGALLLYAGFEGTKPAFWDRFMLAGGMAMPIAFFVFVQAFLMHERRNWEIFGAFCYILFLVADFSGYLVTGTQVLNGRLFHEFGPAFIPSSIVWILFISFSIIDLILELQKTRVAFYGSQIKYLMATGVLTFLGILIDLSGRVPFPADIVFNIAAAAFISYAIFKHQLLDLDIVVRKWLLYLIPILIVGAIYFGLIYLLLGVINLFYGLGIFIVALLVAVVVALVGRPLHNAVQNWFDRLFYRENYNATRMLQRLSQAAVSILDLDALTRMILKEVTSTMHIRHAGLFLKKDQTGDFYLMGQVGMNVGKLKLGQKHPLITYFKAKQKAVTDYDLEVVPNFLALWKQERQDLEKIDAKLYIPLKAERDLVGLLAVGPKLSGESYSQDDQMTLETLANQTAAAIENALLFAAEARRRKDAEILRKTLMGLTNDLDLQQVLESMLDQMEKVIPYDSACVFLLEKDHLKAVAARGFSRLEEVVNHDYPVEGDRLFLEMRTNRRPVILSDAQSDSRLKGYGGTHDVRSWIGIPMILRGEVTGCLTLDSYTQGAYNELEHADLVQEFANHAVVAVENARLFKVERYQRRMAESLREVGTLLSSTLDFEKTLDLLLDQIGRVLPYDQVNILLNGGDHHLKLARTRISEKIDPTLALHADGLSAEVSELPNLDSMIASRKPMVISDVTRHPGWIQRNPLPARSWMGAPVYINEQLLACFSLVKFEADFYNEQYSGLLAILAGQAALALQNARLFTEIQQLAIIDDLTNIFNRRHLLELGKREFNRAQRFNRSLGVIMLDLDYFRNVNDIFGHAVGDQVLRLVAERCRNSIREVDVIGRYGGEEFVIICPEAGLEQAQTVAERLRKQISRAPFDSSGGSVNLTASLGIAIRTDDTPDLFSLIDKADRAMYAVKRNKRDRIDEPGEVDPA